MQQEQNEREHRARSEKPHKREEADDGITPQETLRGQHVALPDARHQTRSQGVRVLDPKTCLESA